MFRLLQGRGNPTLTIAGAQPWRDRALGPQPVYFSGLQTELPISSDRRSTIAGVFVSLTSRLEFQQFRSKNGPEEFLLS